tara:strand:- start:1959 stop:2066 length:108 start_codon:yes stop_codon:yes gene_type:complete
MMIANGTIVVKEAMKKTNSPLMIVKKIFLVKRNVF